jgi:hypothetical protein
VAGNSKSYGQYGENTRKKGFNFFNKKGRPTPSMKYYYLS